MHKARFYILVMLLAVQAPGLRAQVLSDSLPKILNLDSLSADDQELLSQYQDSFKNDFYTVLDVFNINGKPKEDTSVFDMDRSSHAEVGLDFVSRELINGRIIALNTTKGRLISLSGVGFYPAIAYYHKTGLFVSLSTTFYTDSALAHATSIPVISPSAGFSHTFFRRWFLSTSYVRNFNTYGSAESRILLNNEMSFTSSIDIWKRIIFSSTLYVYWSSDHAANVPADEKSSVEILLTLKKDFRITRFIGATEFTITPAMNFYFANDNRTYVSALGVSDVKKDNKKDTIQKTENTNDFFGFLDLEPSVTLDWRIRNLDINFAPVLAIPFNVFAPLRDKRFLNPKIYRFYVQAGIKYYFCVKSKKKLTISPVSDSLL